MAGYERLSVEDRLHLDLEDPNIHTHIAAVLVIDGGPLLRDDGGVDIDRVRDLLDARLFRLPRYRQRIARIPVSDHPVWVDDASFNLAYHVRHTHLPTPGDERLLKRLVGRVVSQKLDRGKPLWEMWVVEGLEHDRIALVAKVHHCMADGIASVQLFQALLSLEPEKEFDPPPVWLPRPVPEPGELLRDAVRQRLKMPLELMGSLISALREPRQSAAQLRRGIESLRASQASQALPASETPLNEPIGPHRRFDWLSLDLDEVRRVRRAVGGTLNDLVLATVTGAAGDFLEQRGISRRDQEELDFRVSCPVSTRRRKDRARSGNRVSALIVPLPLAEQDPVARLRRITETTRSLKETHQELAAKITQAVSEYSWPGLYTSFARGMLEGRSANLIVSDVPGPRAPLYLLGARVLEAYPLVPLLPGQALGIACLSYAGGLFWGFNADWDRVPDLHDFVIAVDRSFRELCEAVQNEEA
ncbi:MAG: WS/DGAT/MGAT family O-acyltransferase [Myxococcota bacterium]